MMTISLEDALALEQLELRLKAILPELYSDSYEDILPVSMGSAPLRYDADGNVAWNEMWASFCDLAMAGGPPHRGTLLQPAPIEEIQVALPQYDQTVNEICRGISLVTGLPVKRSEQPGWIEIQCNSFAMAAWLVRAIVMENVLARHENASLFLPAGPGYRLNKEVKNVITVIAKTCHYWLNHTPESQQQSIGETLAAATAGTSLLEPALHAEIVSDSGTYTRVLDKICQAITASPGLPCFKGRYPGWIGVECASVRKAVWLMRAMVTENILARRESEVLFLPVNPKHQALEPERLVGTFSRLYHLSMVARV